MPYAAKKPCCHPGCGLTTHDRYCEEHRKQFFREQNTYAHATRDAGFYNRARWRKVREQQLRKKPLCFSCMTRNRVTPATVVDHIKPRRAGGEDYSSDNLQSLCASCHNAKTASERKAK